MKKIIILYFPVLHQGYLNFLEKYWCNRILYLPNKKLIDEFTTVTKEIRQISSEKMRVILSNGKTHSKDVKILNHDEIIKLRLTKNIHIITANDTVSLGITERYFPNIEKEVDTTFLRWDEKSVYSKKPVSFDRVSHDHFDQLMIKIAKSGSKKSSDWWRQVGAVIIKEGKIILQSHNQHVPSEHTPYVFGDPRDFIEAGKNCEISSTMHAEKTLIVEAAKKGVSLDGATLYVNVFPCPGCAKMVAYSGIKNVFFSSGHASLDGETILKSKKVKLILVKK